MNKDCVAIDSDIVTPNRDAIGLFVSCKTIIRPDSNVVYRLNKDLWNAIVCFVVGHNSTDVHKLRSRVKRISYDCKAALRRNVTESWRSIKVPNKNIIRSGRVVQKRV